MNNELAENFDERTKKATRLYISIFSDRTDFKFNSVPNRFKFDEFICFLQRITSIIIIIISLKVNYMICVVKL